MFTFITVILSALISLLISAYYFRKGNRANLEVSVIYPLCNALKKSYSNENYELISKLSKEYSIRYMNTKEKIQLNKLLKAYELIANSSMNSISATILSLYFEYKMKEANININCIPMEDEGKLLGYVKPYELSFMYDDILKLLKITNFYFYENYGYQWGGSIEEEITKIYHKYINICQFSNEVEFFKDKSAIQIVECSKEYKKWKDDLKNFAKEKEQFLNLKICKTNKYSFLDV